MESDGFLLNWIEIEKLKSINKALEKENTQKQIKELSRKIGDAHEFIFQCCEIIQPGYKNCHSHSLEEAKNFIKSHLYRSKNSIHMAECYVNCVHYSDATCYSGQCAKHSKVIVRNNQVCECFEINE